MKHNSWILVITMACICCLFILMPACKKKDKTSEETVPEKQLPVLVTGNAENISQTKVQLNCSVSDEGSSAVTARGICWSEQANPTINNRKTINGAGAGSFNSQIKALAANTKYYVRAYASNSFGTAYGNEISFTTLKDADGTVTDADGNVYHVIKIGNQYWLKESLKTLSYRNGDSIKAWGEQKIGGCCYLGNAEINGTEYGVMYNWYAVGDSRGLAPAGWHIPSAADWQSLIDFAGGEEMAGGKLKETGTAHWNSPNEGASDDFGFSAKGGGVRFETGTFFGVGYQGFYWASTEWSGSLANEIFIRNDSKNAHVDVSPKGTALYVRCIRD